MNFDDLYVSSGEKLPRSLASLPCGPRLDKFHELLRRLKSMLSLSCGDGVRVHESSEGKAVVADARGGSFKGAFMVSASTNEVTVSLGTINDRVPVIGAKSLDAIPAPKLKITPGGNADRRSWIALRVTLDRGAGDSPTLEIGEAENAISIVHVTDLRSADPLIGLHAIAMLVWSEQRTIKAIHQITYFSQQHASTRDARTNRIRHLFWPA